MLEAMAAAGYRDFSGFRRGAHVICVGHFYPDVDTVIARINGTEVAARWASELDGVISTASDADGRNVTAREIYHQP
jgi:L-rhamnose mutarotase